MKVNEIFNSVMGEVNYYGQGSFATFIRLSGCNLKCSYCDTKYHTTYTEMTIDEIIEKVESFGCSHVLITGGEPLVQRIALGHLTKQLWYKKYFVSVETNGTIALNGNGYGVNSWIMDCKLRSSGNTLPILESQFVALGKNDFIKFVITSLHDYKEAVTLIDRWKKRGLKATIAFSPAHGLVDPTDLINKLQLEGRYDIVVNVQLHKYIGAR